MMPKSIVRQALRCAFVSPERFSRLVLRRPLRPYQVQAARAIVSSVLQGLGMTFAVMMSRQAGKNETAAHVEACLLNGFQRRGGYIVKAAPTFRPQTLNSLRRLQQVLERSTLPRPTREAGNTLRLGRARAAFYSAGKRANVVGATADILLEGDEAQDIDVTKWNKDFRPMGASTNCTCVLWGTAWTSDTLLARTIRELRWAERRDHRPRVFLVPWQDVAAVVPAYGRYVRGEMERLGCHHPLIRTQYYLQEIDDEAALFPPATRVLMRGTHERQRHPSEGREYAILVDVAGPAEEALRDAALREAQPRKDSTALTIVEVSRSSLGLVRYLVMDRYLWTGTPHHELYGAIMHLAELWDARHVVVDATGLGAGLASFLQRALGERIVPYVFGTSSKSNLGWSFLGICGSGRFLDHRDDGSGEYRQFWDQVRAARYEVIEGPDRRMRWGVSDPALHDDLLVSAALCAALESVDPAAKGESQVIEAGDPLGSMTDGV